MVYRNSFTVIYDDLSMYLNTHDRSLLKEDMLQLSYKDSIVDLGYYSNGFILYVVKAYDWDAPIKKEHIQENDIVAKIDEICDAIVSSLANEQ